MSIQKRFKLRADQIKPLAAGYGGAFATDLITVEGHKVGYMYRELPDFEADSGWRFMAGHEPDVYMDNSDNFAIYDVNTIANYDPEIIPFLDAPFESAFARDEDTGEFEEVEYEPVD